MTAPPGKRVTTEEALAAHVIEPELLGGYPRWVQADYRHGRWTATVSEAGWLMPLLGASAVLFYLLVQNLVLPLIYTALLIVLVIDIVVKIRAKKPLRDHLKYGIPKPAVVTQVLRRHTEFEVIYLFEDKAGTLKQNSVLVTDAVLKARHLKTGSTFTLLQLPSSDDDAAVPYFTIEEFKIIPVVATRISNTVSAAIAAQSKLFSAQSTTHTRAELEPEFRTTTPRHVRATGRARRGVFWSVAALALVGTGFFAVPDATGERFAWFVGVVMAALLSLIIVYALRPRPLQTGVLRDWYPAIADVVSVSVSQQLGLSPAEQTATVIYTHESLNGEIRHGSVTMEQRRLWQLQLEIGARFTVLCDPNQIFQPVPYFAVEYAEIVGATAAKITPP